MLVSLDGAPDATVRATGARSESGSASPEAFTGVEGEVGPFTAADSADRKGQTQPDGNETTSSTQISSSASENGNDDAAAQGNPSDDAASIVTVRRLNAIRSSQTSTVRMISISNGLRHHENVEVLSLRQQSSLESIRGRILRHGIEGVNDDSLAPAPQADDNAQDDTILSKKEGKRPLRGD